MRTLKELLKILPLLGIAIGIGTILLLGVYACPTGKIKSNVAASSHIFDVEEAFPELIPGYQFTRLDNFTDSIMLAIAMYDGEENIVEKSMSNYRMRSDELGIVKSTTHYANDVVAEYYRHAYPRYWHGYLVLLKPLLAFFDYGEIRILNSCFQIGMCFLAITLMSGSKIKSYLPAYITAFLFLNPATVSMSLQYSAIYNIMLTILVLWLSLMKAGKLSAELVTTIFLMAGCVTSYIDFLTYPIAVVGLLAILSINSWESTWKNIGRTLKNIIYWGIGYAGMWAGKWTVGSVLLSQNLFQDAGKQFLLRSSKGGEGSSRLGAIVSNIKVYENKIFVFILLTFCAYVIFSFLKKKVRIEKKHWNTMIAYGGISFMPFVWMLLTANHSKEHAWFVHRGFFVTVLAVICMIIYVRENCCTGCEK